MFILHNKQNSCNYPKYVIIRWVLNIISDSLYYVISNTIYLNYRKNTDNFPAYFITSSLYFDLTNKVKFSSFNKFDLSKLGTDYILKDICIHFKEECTGSYPDNYIFVIEPDWPETKENVIDRTSLKFKSKYLSGKR